MADKLFPNAQVRLDPWAPDYGSSLLATDDGEEAMLARVKVDCSVEEAEQQWRAVRQEADLFDDGRPVAFVDGVRRIECNLVFEGSEGFRYGALASFAAGGVVMQRGQLNRMSESLAVCSVKRYVFVPEGVDVPDTIALPVNFPAGAEVNVGIHRIAGESPIESMSALQQLMREEEAIVCRELAEKGAVHPLIADGPLNLALVPYPVVGFIKSFHNLYVPYSLCPVLTQLQPGERTPIFLIEPRKTRGAMSRYSCYARVAAQRPQDSALAGLARFEVSADMGFEDARSILNHCASIVPRFGSPQGRDPRAPQNLFPLRTLENELRRRMGSTDILKRILQEALAA